VKATPAGSELTPRTICERKSHLLSTEGGRVKNEGEGVNLQIKLCNRLGPVKAVWSSHKGRRVSEKALTTLRRGKLSIIHQLCQNRHWFRKEIAPVIG